ncbi:MAG: PadR family transcriptional regulator [Longimicrobiales bacterium]|nr:PadR family transcriptional regulator [Longimicrobiales bacterium]
MGDERAELVPGTLDMLVMKAVSAESLHGFGIARWIEATTGDRLTVEEGALYPALHRMEKRGALTSEWRKTERGRRARFYRLTAQGRRELVNLRARWESSAWAVRQILDAEVES